MKVIAHRGFCGEYPENTMISFKKAVEAGCDELELDVQLTKDNVLVIIHDETIDRVTDGTGNVKDYTFEELRKFNVMATFGDKHGFNPIPSFEEYVSWVKDKDVTTNIELKTGHYYYKELEEKVVDMILKYGIENKVMFSSFNHLSLIRCKELVPNIECGVLVNKRGIGNPGYYVSKYNFECYHPDIEGLDDDIIEDCRAHNVKLNVWTVNDEVSLKKLYDWGCNGAITDYPGLCKEWLKSQEGK
jgi:glycerophosphoryl diester phosphodiesterase